ncbi:hypothetical protein [Acetobacterium tundrae]|uniref:Transposase n=1 Tax=Acetobacterium tundrae TaxID=132932 RepID=A0ABR6WLZ6_9FIRM|nr:hypothetical protein [Acetobacterium tundrae]MBC3797321.1 hypothetical protein [Acetobacterium tundrae]
MQHIITKGKFEMIIGVDMKIDLFLGWSGCSQTIADRTGNFVKSINCKKILTAENN